ncbi:MAG: DNA recombination protein RmuC [Phycisphaerae bacterium]|nr:DNA recombination protein RmuC [Phycisphaerae bacterium]
MEWALVISVIGLVLAIAASAWVYASRARADGEWRARLAQLEAERQADKREIEAARTQARNEGERLNQMRDSFASLAGQALKDASGQLLELASAKLAAVQEAGVSRIEEKRAAVEGMVRPIADTLRRTEEHLTRLESVRTTSQAELLAQVRHMLQASAELRDQTGKLARALSEPHVRGRWGEQQLRRVVELAGLREYCDFSMQEGTRDADGNLLKPDMIVHLPSGRELAVDAKTNIAAYLDAVGAPPEQSEAHLDRFARHVSEQVGALARKGYWRQYEGSPDFVVMFIPGDQFVDAALSRRPDLLEYAFSQRVVIASTSSLIGLLRVIALGWEEKRLASEARELRKLGVEFHERAATALQNIARLGGSLESAVDHYNRFVASYVSRLEPTLRRFEESGVRGSKETPEIPHVSVQPRAFQPALTTEIEP